MPFRVVRPTCCDLNKRGRECLDEREIFQITILVLREVFIGGLSRSRCLPLHSQPGCKLDQLDVCDTVQVHGFMESL